MSYVPSTPQDQAEMLKVIGKSSIEELFADVPEKARLRALPNLPAPLSESELLAELEAVSSTLSSSSTFLGAGSYNHFIPSVVKHLVGRSEFYTAYTPYQAEASQGMLQAIFEYQTMICELTGMDVANASMYDGATALAEAALMACAVTKRNEIVVSSTVHPAYRQVLKTYAKASGKTVVELPYDQSTGLTSINYPVSSSSSCVILQQPNFFGCIENAHKAAEEIHRAGALYIVSADPISLGLLKAPGDYGADIVVGEGQSLGNPQSFGGPGLGIFAVKKGLVRQMPGRIVGETVDAEGKRAFCLTLSTREQHIRREKASSNICSNEALAALAACVYLSVMGKQGLRKVAELCLQKANYLREKFRHSPSSPLIFPDSPCFNEFVVQTEKPIGVELGQFYPELKGRRLICVTEQVKIADLDRFAA